MSDQGMSDAWSAILRSIWIRDANPQNLRFSGVPAEEPDGGLSVVLDDSSDVVLGGSEAAEALDDLCTGLAARWSDSTIPHDLTVHVMRYAAEAVRGDGASIEDLFRTVESWTAKSLVAVPVGGVFSSAPEAIVLGHSALAGHVSRETEQAIGDLAVREGLHGFRFTPTWWTEEFLAAEADAAIAAEIAEAEEQEGTWQPLVVVLALPAVGVVAACRAVWATEAILGGMIAMHEPQPAWFRPMPWVMGQASVAENPRSPTLGNDGCLSESPIQVDSLPSNSLHGYAPLEPSAPASDLDLAEELESGPTQTVLTRLAQASVETSHADRRLVVACRLAFAATKHPPDLGLILLEHAARELRGAHSLASESTSASADDAFAEAPARWAAFRELLVAECTPH